jgi:4-hydroxybutyrate dehydrogenase/sulfolactaldehyde 3-reductase
MIVASSATSSAAGSPIQRVAFIGLGVMGGAMLRNLAKKGFACAGYDVSAEATARVADSGCRIATSPADAARNADVLITMLPTSVHTREALFGGDGAAAVLRDGALVVEMSTGDAVETDRIGEKLADRGLRCMDAPVGRTPREAAEGKALIMAGGSDADLADARPLFEAMADTIVHVGPFGSGIRLKLVNNYMAMVGMVLTGEALMFAAKLGLDRETVVRVLSNTTAGRGQLLTNFPRKVLAGDISPDFPLRMGLKDIQLAMNLAGSVGAPLGLGGYAREMFALAQSWGRENQDCTAMLLLLEDVAHVAHESAHEGVRDGAHEGVRDGAHEGTA